ncbi:MAG: hypothetical protein Q9186_006824 [Xanthomendoza sp. 1 TL-2023]
MKKEPNTTSAKSTEEILKDSFEDLKTLIDIRKHVPRDDVLYPKLQSIIERDSAFCKGYHLEHFDELRELMAESTFIQGLFRSLDDTPIARKNVSDILFKEMQWSNEKVLKQDSNNGYLLAQQSIFRIWKTMQSPKFDSGAMELAMLQEIMSHSRRYHNSSKSALAKATADTGLCQSIEVMQKQPEPRSFQVNCIVFPRKVIRGRSVFLVLAEKRRVLNLTIDGISPRKTGSRLYIDISAIVVVYHSYRHLCIQICYDHRMKNYVDVRLRSAEDGVRLLQKIKSLQECEVAMK